MQRGRDAPRSQIEACPSASVAVVLVRDCVDDRAAHADDDAGVLIDVGLLLRIAGGEAEGTDRHLDCGARIGVLAGKGETVELDAGLRADRQVGVVLEHQLGAGIEHPL